MARSSIPPCGWRSAITGTGASRVRTRGWRGRGISMIHALADGAQVQTLETGTVVTMSWSLPD